MSIIALRTGAEDCGELPLPLHRREGEGHAMKILMYASGSVDMHYVATGQPGD